MTFTTQKKQSDLLDTPASTVARQPIDGASSAMHGQLRQSGALADQQSLLAPSAPVQCHGGGTQDPAMVQQAAAQGVSGGGGRLPHLERIQHSFGDHDVANVQAHTGSGAGAACEAIGASAYATGNSVAFNGTPDLFTAAHEAAHVVQQRAGVSLSGGVGSVGDSYEQNADAVASRVVAGQSAADLLGRASQGGGSAPVQSKAVQRYSEHNVEGKDLKLGAGSQALWIGSAEMYASDARISESNAALAGAGQKGSFIRLVKGTVGYEAGGNDLYRVEPEWVAKADPGYHKGAQDANKPGAKDTEGVETGKDTDRMAFWTDCGRSSAAVIGSQGNDREALFNDGGGEKTADGVLDGSTVYRATANAMSNEIYLTMVPKFIAEKANEGFLKEGTHYTKAADSDAKVMKTPGNVREAKVMYWELGEAGRDKFDKEAGINHYANPEIGEAYSMTTEAEMPGFKRLSKRTWNFHWAGVVMKDGSDNVTLEAYAVTRETAEKAGLLKSSDYIDRDSRFAMYGGVDANGKVLDESQTFHHDHLASKTHGSHASSIRVRAKK